MTSNIKGKHDNRASNCLTEGAWLLFGIPNPTHEVCYGRLFSKSFFFREEGLGCHGLVTGYTMSYAKLRCISLG